MNVICAKQRSTSYTVSLFSKSVAYKLSVLYTFLLAFGHELSAIPSCNGVVFMCYAVNFIALWIGPENKYSSIETMTHSGPRCLTSLVVCIVCTCCAFHDSCLLSKKKGGKLNYSFLVYFSFSFFCIGCACLTWSLLHCPPLCLCPSSAVSSAILFQFTSYLG